MNRGAIAETLVRLETAQKSARGASPYSQLINRPLGRRLACGAHLLGLTPNAVTLVSAICTLTGIALIGLGWRSLTAAAIIGVTLVLGYALDSADGQLARLHGGGSVSGEWLDHMVDCVKIATFHLAVFVGMWRSSELDPRWNALPLAFAVVADVTFFGKILNDQLRRNRGLLPGRQATDFAWYKRAVAAPRDYGVLAVAMFLWSVQAGFLAVYAALFVVSSTFLVVSLRRWYHEMRSLDPA